jgi:hypothetical protein
LRHLTWEKISKNPGAEALVKAHPLQVDFHALSSNNSKWAAQMILEQSKIFTIEWHSFSKNPSLTAVANQCANDIVRHWSLINHNPRYRQLLKYLPQSVLDKYHIDSEKVNNMYEAMKYMANDKPVIEEYIISHYNELIDKIHILINNNALQKICFTTNKKLFDMFVDTLIKSKNRYGSFNNANFIYWIILHNPFAFERVSYDYEFIRDDRRALNVELLSIVNV